VISVRKSPQKRNRDCDIFYAYEGRKRIGGLSACLNLVGGREVFQVSLAFMNPGYDRRGFGTKLYEAAAQEACRRGWAFASSPRWALSQASSGFWDKQISKGRATEDTKAKVIVLNRACDSDLRGLQMRRRRRRG
jgi:GNAT superfamily N-acetyltransferase